jgi:hypothetical protein
MHKNKILLIITLIFIVIAVICIYISSEPSNTPPVSKPVEYKIVLAKKAPTLEGLHKSSEHLIDTRKIDDSKIQVKALLQDEIQLEHDLISALADESEDVRFSALSTLENYMLGLEEVSNSRKTIHSQLTAKTLSSELPQDTRDALTDILSDESSQ